MSEANERRLIRVTEAAERLSISRSRAYLMAQRGELPGQVRLGGSIRVSARALDEWIDRQASAPQPA
jgi:excisionase family DNA binding protein